MRVYLDHASTSPTRPGVAEAVLTWLDAADPGRVHTEGRLARAALEGAREEVAALFGTRPRQVIFTSGATEAINAAVFGATQARPGGQIVLAEVEHSAVREASQRHSGVRWVGVDSFGRVDAAEVAAAVDEAAALAGAGSGGGGRPGTALVHCQWANHEVGTLQPVQEVVAACRERGVLVHVDAAAAAGQVPVDFDALGADLMSVSAHKLGGPKGAGALLVRRGLRLEPLIVGGEQERGRRGGMEDVSAVVGFGTAAAAVGGTLFSEEKKARRLSDRLRGAAMGIRGVVAYGPTEPDGRLPGLVCLGVDGVEAEAVLLGLDQAGVAAHSGSACSSESLEPSPVLAAMGVPAERSLRLSVGWSTTDEEVEFAAARLPEVVARLRSLAR